MIIETRDPQLIEKLLGSGWGVCSNGTTFFWKQMLPQC